MAAFNKIVLEKGTAYDREAAGELSAHVQRGIISAPALTPPSNGRSMGTKVSGGARISGGRG